MVGELRAHVPLGEATRRRDDETGRPGCEDQYLPMTKATGALVKLRSCLTAGIGLWVKSMSPGLVKLVVFEVAF